MEALANPTSGLTVSEVGNRAQFLSLEKEWNGLVRSTGDQLFYRHELFRIWIDNFAPASRLRILTARDGAGVLAAALPLLEERTFLYGVPLRQLGSASNPHSCRFDLLAREPRAASRAFLQYLEADQSWDLLRLRDVPEGGAAWHLLQSARQAGMPVGSWESMRSPFVPLPQSRTALMERLDSKFKANLRRRRRRLEEKGSVSLERVTGGEQLDARLEEGFALEQEGWKGRRGTAIAQQKATRGFYSELARAAKYGGFLSLYFLRLEGRPVAFHLGLAYGEKYLLLKPAYDETLAECSPGQLLVEEVLADCIARGFSEFDFLGPEMTWKRDWTDRLRPHSFLFAFRDTNLGRALCTAKFRLAARAKETLARWRH